MLTSQMLLKHLIATGFILQINCESNTHVKNAAFLKIQNTKIYRKWSVVFLKLYTKES